MSAESSAREVLLEHRKGYSCCYADRGPCYYDGREKSLCSADTCMACSPSPYNGKPVWPCAPVELARAVLGKATSDAIEAKVARK